MIQLKKLAWASVILSEDLTEFQEQQTASKIEKWLKRELSIVCETEVKHDK